MKAIDPQIRRSALLDVPKYDAESGITDPDKDLAAIGRKADANIVSPDQSLVTPEGVAAAHAAGLLVAPFTVDTEVGWREMADAGVDAIITDDPAALLGWLRAQRPALHP